MCDICTSHPMYDLGDGLRIPRGPMTAERNGKEMSMGYSEIRIVSSAVAVYAAPSLIYHYVAVHNYAPPRDFVESILRKNQNPVTS